MPNPLVQDLISRAMARVKPGLESLEQFSIGAGHGITNNLNGLYNLATDPYAGTEMLEGLYQAASQPKQTLAGLGQYVKQSASSPLNAGMFLGEMADPGMFRNLLRKPNVLGNIVSPEQAATLNTAKRIPDSTEFASAVANTPGASITDDGLVMRIARRQPADAEGAQSIRTGVFYLPEGDKRLGKFYKGKNGYGGTDEFSGETVYKSPLFVKGATGGKAPENAYEMVSGKGAFKSLEDDIFKSMPRYNDPADVSVKKIGDLLERYGADRGMAYKIHEVTSRTGGNTLRYAIQENIIANAVRNAGYDGIIGYSKAKTGPFISEVFDVREMTYPSSWGYPDIHERFIKE